MAGLILPFAGFELAVDINLRALAEMLLGNLDQAVVESLQLGAVILHPAPDGCVIDVETTLLQKFLHIAQRKRIAKIPQDRTKYEIRFGLSPFEDPGSGYHFAIRSHHQPAPVSRNTSV